MVVQHRSKGPMDPRCLHTLQLSVALRQEVPDLLEQHFLAGPQRPRVQVVFCEKPRSRHRAAAERNALRRRMRASDVGHLPITSMRRWHLQEKAS
jgi:hypothetical protein